MVNKNRDFKSEIYNEIRNHLKCKFIKNDPSHFCTKKELCANLHMSLRDLTSSKHGLSALVEEKLLDHTSAIQNGVRCDKFTISDPNTYTAQEIIESKKYNEYNLLVQKSEHKSMVEQYWENNLSEENKKLLVSLDTLNSKIEKNLQITEDARKEKVKELNLVILQLKKENEKILNEYEDVFKKNLELDLQLKSLNMEIKSLNIEKRETISQLEQVINEQKEIIELLKVNNPH